MNKMNDSIRKIIRLYKEPNRQNYLLVGIATYSLFLMLGAIFGMSEIVNVINSTLVCLMIVLFAAFCDEKRNGTFDWYDAVALMSFPTFVDFLYILTTILK